MADADRCLRCGGKSVIVGDRWKTTAMQTKMSSTRDDGAISIRRRTLLESNKTGKE